MTRTAWAPMRWMSGAALVSVFVATEHAQAQQGTIAGTIVSAETSQPLADARVLVVGSARITTSSPRGTFEISLPAGAYRLRVYLIGYAPAEEQVTVPPGGTAAVAFRLTPSPTQVEELVVIGSRTTRSTIETPVPVDVITSAEIKEVGQTEINQILATVAPAFNASHQTIADGTDHINPASLRGLGPDQVLVLVNGKRRHPSALVHVNGTFGRGTVGVDLNAIPTSAIERIEVLRDGAAAQYGSDAISGVINIVLKDDVEQIDYTSSVGVTGEGDGEQVKAEANYGFRIGGRGFLNVSAEYLTRERTDRANPWTGDIFPGITGTAATDAELAARGLTRRDFTMQVGQSAAEIGMAAFNTVVPIGDVAEFYSFGGASFRNGSATGFYRLPNQTARVVPQIYPNGFLPEIATGIVDQSFYAGVRGNTNGWDIDFSLGHGFNAFQFNIENSNNASLGASSPITFDAGRLVFNQSTGNLDVVRPIDTGGALRSLAFVTGAEFRTEAYRIEPGEAASWQLGNGGSRPGIDFDTTASGAPKEPGSQVFPGFQPSNAVNRSRNSIGVYGGFESELSDKLLIDIGGRFEDYSDFGNTVNGKIAARYEVARDVSLRGAVSTGFRAPSLQQAWFNNVSIQFLINPSTGALDPSRVLTSNNQSRVTKAFGVPDLKEETSVNLSAGLTARPTPELTFTADVYRVEIDDRIVLSSRFANSDTIVARLLQPFQREGVTAAQFFTNAVDTKTTGLDIVASYTRQVGSGLLTLTGAANFTKTEVQRVNIPAAVADTFANGDLEAVRGRLFDREERNRLETALPRTKGSFSARYAAGRLAILGRATYYGSIEYRPTDPALDETFGAKTLIDLDLSYELFTGLRLNVGGANIFNTFPDEQTKPANISDGRFVYSRRVTQFGMNGGYYYARLRVTI